MKYVFLILIALFVTPACYKCADKECSNVPPVEPNYPANAQAGDWPAPGEPVVAEAEDSPAAVTSPCGRSCLNWKRLGCPEANPSASGLSCYRVCTTRASLIRIPSKCWSEAQTVAALRACGGIRCVP